MAAIDDNVMREAFCVAYVNDKTRNGTQAAIAAGYTSKPECAAVQASRLLKDVKVKDRIRELEAQMLAQSGYKGSELNDRIMRELAALAFSRVTDYVCVSDLPERPKMPPDKAPAEVWDAYHKAVETRKAALKELADKCGGQNVLDFGGVIYYPNRSLTLEQEAALKSLNVRNVGGKFPILAPEVEVHDKLGALKILAEITGLKQADTTVNIALSDRLEKARRRAAATVTNDG